MFKRPPYLKPKKKAVHTLNHRRQKNLPASVEEAKIFKIGDWSHLGNNRGSNEKFLIKVRNPGKEDSDHVFAFLDESGKELRRTTSPPTRI